MKHVTATVFELSRVNPVQWIIFSGFRGPDITVHSCQARICGDVIQPSAGGFYAGFGVPKINKGSGRAHGRKGSRGDHIHFLRGFFGTIFFDNADHFIGRDHNNLSLFNLPVNVIDCFGNLFFRHFVIDLPRIKQSLEVSPSETGKSTKMNDKASCLT